MLLINLVQSALVALPFMLIHEVLQHSINTEINRALSLVFYVTAITVFFWNFLLQLCRPGGLLVSQFDCHEDWVNKLYHDVKFYAPGVWVLAIVIGFTDALTDDVVRNSIGRAAFILLCIWLALFALGWTAMSRSGKALYSGKRLTLIQNPKLWMSLLFLQQFYMIIMAVRGYYFAALYQSILICQSIW